MPTWIYIVVASFILYTGFLVLGGKNQVIHALPGENIILPCKQLHNRRSRPLSVQLSVKRLYNSSWSPLSVSRFILNWKLGLAVLKNVTAYDSGTYHCVTYYASGNPLDEEFYYEVHVNKLNKDTVREGDIASLRCNMPRHFEDIGNISYRWEKVNMSLPDNYRLAADGSLIIFDADPRDSGMFICTATNNSGRVWSDRVYLQVEYLHTSIKQVATFPDNGNIIIECKTKGYPRNIIFYHWIHESNVRKLLLMGTSHGKNRNTLIIRNSPVSNGMYSCQVGNGIFNKTASIVIYLGKRASDRKRMLAVGIGIGTLSAVAAFAVILVVWLKKPHIEKRIQDQCDTNCNVNVESQSRDVQACPAPKSLTSGSDRSQWSGSSTHGYEYIHGTPCKSRTKLGARFYRYSCSNVSRLLHGRHSDRCTLLSSPFVNSHSAPAVCDNGGQYEMLQERKCNDYIGLISGAMDTQAIYDVVKTQKLCDHRDQLPVPQTPIKRDM